MEDQSRVSDEGLVAKSTLFLALSNFEVSEHQETKSSTRSAGGETDQEQPKGEAAVREVPLVQEAPRRVRDTGTRASVERTLSRAVEAALESTQQNVSFEYSVSNW